MDQIKQLEQEIVAKKQELKELKKQERKNKVFAETTVGKKYYGFLRAISKPFHSLHQNADAQLINPRAVAQQTVMNKAHSLLVTLVNCNPEEERATKLAVEAAKLVVKLENLGAEEAEITLDLRQEVERLRPQKTEVETELFNKISDIVDEEIEKCCQLPRP